MVTRGTFAFDLDALPTSHPVYQEVGDPAEIIQLFDDITYGKVTNIYYILLYVSQIQDFAPAPRASSQENVKVQGSCQIPANQNMLQYF